MSILLSQMILLMALPALMIYACFSDLFTMRISNRLCLTVVGAFLVFALVATLPPLLVAWHLLAGLMVLIVSFSLFSFGWIGGGDAKFVAAVAVWFGFGQLWEFMAVSSILGGGLTLGLLMLRNHPIPQAMVRIGWINKLHDKRTGVPYGIALGVTGIMLLPFGMAWQIIV